jgi:hypothetical protein
MMETFLVESWMEHQRQHERVTHTDKLVPDAVDRVDVSGEPKVTHFITAEAQQWAATRCGTLSIDRPEKLRHYPRRKRERAP